jgi:hypothetical protein
LGTEKSDEIIGKVGSDCVFLNFDAGMARPQVPENRGFFHFQERFFD